jgi:hypothetical protein
VGTEQSPYARVVAQARSDEAFRKRLKDDPRAALAEHGIAVPREKHVNVVENTADTVHLVLPSEGQPELEGEISEQELADMFGGGGFSMGPTGPVG